MNTHTQETETDRISINGIKSAKMVFKLRMLSHLSKHTATSRLIEFQLDKYLNLKHNC